LECSTTTSLIILIYCLPPCLFLNHLSRADQYALLSFSTPRNISQRTRHAHLEANRGNYRVRISHSLFRIPVSNGMSCSSRHALKVAATFYAPAVFLAAAMPRHSHVGHPLHALFLSAGRPALTVRKQLDRHSKTAAKTFASTIHT